MADPPPAGAPTSKIELTISCLNLRDKDYFSKSDPMAVLYVKESGSSTYKEFGRTEVVKDTLNPRFTKKFVLNYRFEEYQKLKFEVYDVDTTRSRLTDHDFLGSTECSLGEIVAYQGIQFRRNLAGPHQHSGCVVVVAEEMVSCKAVPL